MLRQIFIICLFIMAALTTSAAPWDADSIEQIFGGRQLDDIEGIWQFPKDGAKLLIHKSSASTYKIVLLDSPRLDVEPGVTIGEAVITADQARYDANLKSKLLGNKNIKPSQAVLTVRDYSILAIKPYSTGKKISLKRWIPYYLRLTIKDEHAPDGLIAARRIYPFDLQHYKPCL